MNSIILKDESGLITESHILEHIHETLKLDVGDKIKCTVLGVGKTVAEVLTLTRSRCELKLGPISKGEDQWFDLIVGVSRPQTTKKILEHASTFGAREFHFFKAALSEKSYLSSKIFENKAYEEFLLAGLSQSTIYTHLPELRLDVYNPAARYSDALLYPQKFILDIMTDKTFLNVDIDFTKRITLAFGPERGFIDEDIKRFHEAGFQSIKISSSILRVEHAVYSAVSQLELLRGIK